MLVGGKLLSSAGWAKQAPGTVARREMKKKCGSKCFLGPISESCFPICATGTCKINIKGIYAAYVRAREHGSAKYKRSSTNKRSTKRSGTKRSSTRKRSTNKRSGTIKYGRHTKKQYQTIATRAKKMLIARGFRKNLK
jgi:hypothetical protein